MKNIITSVKGSQKGAILITLIVAIVVIGLSGVAMVYFSTTSSYGELIANRQARAYYIGESGVNYALQKYAADKSTFSGELTFSDGEKCNIITEIVPKDGTNWLKIISTGTVGSGFLKTRQLVTKEVKEALVTPPGVAPPTTDENGVPIGFDSNETTQDDDPTNPLDNTWEVVDIPKTDYTIVNGDLLFVGTEAAITLNAGNVNLCESWASNGHLLSYLMQMKVQNSSSPKHFIVGLSFRMQNTTATSDSYGLSFYRYEESNACPSSIDWCKNTNGIQKYLKADNKMFAVLWKRKSNVYTVLAYAEMTPSYGVSVNGDLTPWSTILLRVNEQSGGNHIKAFVKAPTVPATGTINWSVSSFTPVLWTATCPPPPAGPPCTPVTPFAEVVDSEFLSTSFCSGTTQNRPEIGIHGFYDMSCNKCQFFDDFGITVQGTAGGSVVY